MTDPIRWGILGTGNIAKQFARGLTSVEDARLVAVGSRAPETAAAFGDEFEVPHRHATYEALAADDEVDAIYVSTPHPFHKDNSILCLTSGKAVLCEKPFTVNAAEAAAVIDVARAENRFLMEAMWTRFVPAVVRLRQLLAEGAIGDVRMVQADFGFRAGVNPEGRLFNLDLGGGALLDVGIYSLSFAAMILGASPDQVVSAANLGSTGVDEQSAFLLRYEGGELAVLSCA
ncbi:MAG: Gfo/Idh/MocA family oxidoreductase, partial [Candidatus Latescibacterota bacterium]|nr:Gfo/Idh/MocA family oxidoreductase [Candidatus Latescibacterota bacterium]